ncbi:MAG: DNA polymerase III subunit beta [Candidatus Cloacimonas sp.]|jgi:DNA polymerase-3 subunit beta|nr:DNA polymerase III subunit beta [Candidatus Cloacimonas sp.]
MRLAIEKKDLLGHILHLATIVPTKSTSPILNNYLIEVSEETNMVRITASDLEITVVVEFPAAVAEGGTIAVSARHFNEIVNFMPDAIINLWRHDELLMIQSGKVDFNLLIADHTLFPVIPETKLKNAITLDSALFSRMISKTFFAVSIDVNRAVLTGVCWKIFPDHHLMAATDGRKVAEIDILNSSLIPQNETEGTVEENIFTDQEQSYVEKVIPVKTLMFLQKIFDNECKEIGISIDRNKMMFSYGKYFVFSQVIEHKYPEYQKAFPAELPNKFIIDKESLRTAIRRVALVAPDDNLRIRFELDNNRFEVNTSNRDAGDAKQNMDNYNYEGNSTGISFNYKYMLSILDAVDTDKAIIKLGSSKDPMMVYNETPTPGQEITFLLMPLRS